MSYPEAHTVRHITGPQDTSGAAAQALQEQKPGDEFHPLPSPDIEQMQSRLQAIDNEVSTLYAKLWGPPKAFDGNYTGPPYLETERLHRQIKDLDDERASLCYELSQVIQAYALTETNTPAANG